MPLTQAVRSRVPHQGLDSSILGCAGCTDGELILDVVLPPQECNQVYVIDILLPQQERHRFGVVDGGAKDLTFSIYGCAGCGAPRQ